MASDGALTPAETELLREARRRRAAKEPLTQAHNKVLAKYQLGFSRKSFQLYFDTGEHRDAIVAFAEATGAASVSRWMIEQIERAMSGRLVTREELAAKAAAMDEVRQDLAFWKHKAERLERQKDELYQTHMTAMTASMNLSQKIAQIPPEAMAAMRQYLDENGLLGDAV